MSNDIISNVTSHSNDGPRLNNQEIPKIAGEYDGRQVQLKSNASLVEHLSEEITFTFSELTGNKKLKRDAKSGHSSLSRVALAKLYADMVKDIKQSDLLATMGDFKKAQSNDPQNILKLISTRFTDITHKHAVMAYILACLESDSPKINTQEKETVRQALMMLEKEDGAAIVAGYNITEIASQYSQDGVRTMIEMRDLYRKIVLLYETPVASFLFIARSYKYREFDIGVAFLQDGIQAELDAAGPSIAKIQLEKILSDLNFIATLKTFYYECTYLLMHLDMLESPTFSVYMLMENFLKATQDPARYGLQLFDLTKKQAGWFLDKRIRFLNEFMKLLRMLPLKIYKKDNDRLILVQMLQGYIDNTVQVEKSEGLS